MRSGWPRGRRPLALVALAALAALAVTSVLLVTIDREDSGSNGSSPATSQAAPSASASPSTTERGAVLRPAGSAQFYADTRLALSPLIVHVREIPQSLSALALPRGGSFRALASLGTAWASDVATARDLVRRLPVGTQVLPAYAKRLYEVGALLYLQATKSIAVAASALTVSARVATARSALRLLQLGDRTFDSAYRLLNKDRSLSTQEMIFPVTVPDFAAPASAPVYDTAEALAARGVWALQHADSLRVLRRQVAFPSADDDASRVRQRVKALGSPVPGDALTREGSVTIRLAALTVAEAVPATPLATPLTLIGQQLWRIGRDLLAQSRETTAPGLSLELPPVEQDVVQRVLYNGGVFDGTPPPLRPGDEPGAGVPGGLPVLNPLAILGGN